MSHARAGGSDQGHCTGKAVIGGVAWLHSEHGFLEQMVGCAHRLLDGTALRVPGALCRVHLAGQMHRDSTCHGSL